jgi:hypothetical protein
MRFSLYPSPGCSDSFTQWSLGATPRPVSQPRPCGALVGTSNRSDPLFNLETHRSLQLGFLP